MRNAFVYGSKLYSDVETDSGVIVSGNAFIGDSLPSASLPVDTLVVKVRDYGVGSVLLASGGMLLAANGMLAATKGAVGRLDKRVKFGEAVTYEHNDKLLGSFRVQSVTRTAKDEYEFYCTSAIGLLLTENHYGGVYTGERAEDVIADVAGGIITYTIDESLASVPIYGWLKKATRRDNLRDVLFAIGGQIRKDTLGEVNIVPMLENEAYEITPDEFYVGGSVTGGNPASGIKLTEHGFTQLPGDEMVILYDGESAAETLITPKGKTVSGVLVDFPEPVYDLSVQNADILESGANYAVLSGSPAAILTGKKYTHTQRIITRTKDTGGAPNVLTSNACTLVNILNSELVADRLMAYYGSGKVVEADIVVDGHKPGDSVTFTDPFGDRTTGFITDMELTMSAILKAKTTIVSGFTPTPSGNYYSNIAVITESGDFIIPENCKGKIRVVVIGGGDGGECGEAGEAGEEGRTYSTIVSAVNGVHTGQPGKGGKGGKGGLPGKIHVATMQVTPGQKVTAVIGSGGEGAAFGGVPGKGTATIFGNLTSAAGYSVNGYSAIIGEDIYALQGSDGISGGDGQAQRSPQGGGERPTVTYNGGTWQAGTNGDLTTAQITNPNLSAVIAYGSNGSGAAVGANGKNGVVGIAGAESNGTGYAIGANGVEGATPISAPDATIPGSGGNGGHGGGGGSGGGSAIAASSLAGSGGKGGNGGKGGRGANGLILVYF